jgi:hypothetical protein
VDLHQLGFGLSDAGAKEMNSFTKMMERARRHREERIAKAGKHKCIKVSLGTLRRVTGLNGKTLQRPVVFMRFYECKICGKEME